MASGVLEIEFVFNKCETMDVLCVYLCFCVYAFQGFGL
jgi:hypothetical protein